MVNFLTCISLTFLFYLLQLSYVYTLGILILLVPFFFLIRFYQKLKSRIDNLEGNIDFTRQELFRITGNHKNLRVREPWEYPESIRNHPLSIDLDLCNKYGFFSYLDTTVTKQGFQEFLNVFLKNDAAGNKEILERQSFIKGISEKKYKAYLLLKFFHLKIREPQIKSEGNVFVNPISFWKGNFRRILVYLFPILSVFTPLYGIISLLFDLPLLPLLLFCNGMIFLSYRNESLRTWKEIAKLSSTASEFSKLILYVSKEKRITKKQLKQITSLGDSYEILISPLPHIILNVLFFWDLWKIRKFSQWIHHYGEVWNQKWTEIVKLDSVSPFVNDSFLHREYNFPKLTETNTLQASQITHPLLPKEKSVFNPLTDIHPGDLVVITGSNMSGKTTYLRSVAVSLLLARAGSKVCGNNFEFMPFQIHTLIRSQDSLEDGVSFFYSEVRRLADILNSTNSESQIPILFLDEILKGTNSKERYIATRELLFALREKGAIVFVTTHDLKLSEIPWAKQFHFTELEVNGRMEFDYQIRPGVSTSTNALKILKKEGIPIRNEEE